MTKHDTAYGRAPLENKRTDHAVTRWGRTLFTGTAYLALILFDIGAVVAVWQNWGGITLGGWLALTLLTFANMIMLPKVCRSIFGALGVLIAIAVTIAVLIVFGFAAHALLPASAGIAIAIAIAIYVLFQKLDAINANIARSNELKQRELDHRR